MFTDRRVDIFQVMAALDRLTVPSCREVFDRVTMEAVAMASSVVAAAGGRTLGLVVSGETGLFVPLRYTDPLGRAMVQFFKDRGTGERMGRAGRRRIEDFTIENSVERREAIMKESVFNDAGSSECHGLVTRGDA